MSYKVAKCNLQITHQLIEQQQDKIILIVLPETDKLLQTIMFPSPFVSTTWEQTELGRSFLYH